MFTLWGSVAANAIRLACRVRQLGDWPDRHQVQPQPIAPLLGPERLLVEAVGDTANTVSFRLER